MKRWTAMVVIGALALAGCSGSDDDSPTAGSGFEGRGPIRLAIGKDTTGQLNKLVERWNASHADQKVSVTELPEAADGQRQQLVQNAQNKSDAFDVISIDVVWTAEFAAQRWVDELPADQFSTEGFLPPTVDGVSYRGKVYAAPYLTGAGLLYYRTDLLAKAGTSKPPATWAELEQACAKALPQAPGVGCYSGQHDKYEGLTVNFSEAVQSAGGTVIGDDGKPTLDTPQAKAGMGFLGDRFKDGTIPKAAITYNEEAARRAFQTGKLMFMRNWAYAYSLGQVTDGSSAVAGKFQLAVIPGENGPGSSTLGGNNLAVSAFSTKKASALDFIKYLTSQESMDFYAQLSSIPLARAALYDEPALIKKYPYLPVLKKAILAAKPRPQLVRYGDATTAIQEAAYDVERGVKPPDQALADLQTRLGEIAGS